MFLFILGLIFLIVGIFAAIKRGKWTPEAGRYVRAFGVGAIFIALLMIVGSCVTTVSTKNIGIETVYGRTTGHLSNGLHFVAPWVGVTEMDAAIQTDTYQEGSSNSDNTNVAAGPCITVRIANQQTACVDLSIRWRINPNAADELYQNYRTFSNVQDSLVHREIAVSLNQQLADYNPLNTISVEVTGTNYPPTPSLTTVSASVQAQMTQELKDQIEVLSVLIPIMHFDPATQDRLNSLQEQEAQTRIAIAQQQTNTALAQANNDLTQNVDLSPGALESRCLTLLQEALDKGMNPNPAAFNCLGSSNGVIVQSK